MKPMPEISNVYSMYTAICTPTAHNTLVDIIVLNFVGLSLVHTISLIVLFPVTGSCGPHSKPGHHLSKYKIFTVSSILMKNKASGIQEKLF